MKKEIEMNDAIDAIVEAANAMCNPDTWHFDWDMLEPGNIVLNCRRKGGFNCISEVEYALGYCRDCATVIENLLNTFDSDERYCHSEANVWMNDGNELEKWLDSDDEARQVKCVQCQFFND